MQQKKKLERIFRNRAKRRTKPEIVYAHKCMIYQRYDTEHLKRYRHSPPPYFSVHTTCARTHVAFSPALFVSGPIL